MRAARPLALASVLLLSLVGNVATAPAQTPRPGPAKAAPDPVKPRPMKDITFYVAHGDADACGPGCSEWIAAEGDIDADAPQRLRRLLTKLGHRRPPIFFHSPGGFVLASLEVGRIIHAQKLTVSVGYTFPRGCDPAQPPGSACDTLKRSGQELAADLYPDDTMCNSGCVYILAGGTTRLVPPFAKLGIHDIGPAREKKVSEAAAAEAKRTDYARIQEYLRDMGIEKALFTAASAVPNASIRYIKRDEIAQFGIDRREFGESVWHFSPNLEVIYKRFFVLTHNADGAHYRDGFVRLRCAPGQGVNVAFALESDPNNKSSSLPSVRLGLNGQGIDLTLRVPESGFDVRSNSPAASMLEALTSHKAITLSGIDHGLADGIRDMTLHMDGFPAAYAKLRKDCDPTAPVATTPPPAALAASSPDDGSGKVVKAAATRPASLQTVQLMRTAVAAEQLRLDTIEPNCASGPMAVSILQYPRHGALTIENDQTGTCNPDGTRVFYKASSGYVGADSITLNIEYRSGVASTRRYAIEVTAPGSPVPTSETSRSAH